MKRRVQFNPAWAAALVCALLWFALWLVPFQPAPVRQILPPVRPPLAFRPAGAEAFRDLRSPTLFALPSKKGFSGTFPETRINQFVPAAGTDVENTLQESRATAADQPGDQRFYLPRSPVTRVAPDQISLQETIPQLITELPAPGALPPANIPQPDRRIALFLSPELQPRADGPLELNVAGVLPDSVRIHISIRPDGTVNQAIFETPVENEALAGAVRQLRFKPAPIETDSWLELRFTPAKDS